MGNKQIQGSQEFLLTKQQFIKLKIGDKIDHRDYEGKYCPAQIIQKQQSKATVTYEGYPSKYDKTVDYQKRPTDFAQYGSVSKRAAIGPLSRSVIGDFVKYKVGDNNKNSWTKAKIVGMDNKSGQVQIQFKGATGGVCKRWTHLDNQFEVQPLKQNNNNNNRQSRQSSYNPHMNDQYNCHENHGHSHNHNNYNQQSFKQKQIKKQDQMTVRTQLLLDDTEQQCKMIKNYLDGINSGKSKEEITQFNQLVVAGLTLFNMKVGGMRKNGKSEKLDFNDAFKSSAMIIKKFENDMKSQFGHNQFLMKRLEPCLNYMRAVLYGKKVPSLPYINEYEFNQEIAGDVISQVNYAQEHVIPERMKKINDNNVQFKKNQYKLKQEYESNKYNDKVHDVDYNNLIQDFNNKNIAFGVSREEYDKINDQTKYRYQKPDLFNGDGMDVDQ